MSRACLRTDHSKAAAEFVELPDAAIPGQKQSHAFAAGLPASPEFIPPAPDQLLVQPVDAGALAFDLLKMFLHLFPPL